MPAFNNVTTATITLYKIEEVSLYQAELVSTNGTIFHPYDINTDLIFRVYLNNEDITDIIECADGAEAFSMLQKNKIDVLINNAGIDQIKPFMDIKDEDWDSIMQVNLNSVFYCCQEVLENMIHNKNGCIINISSIWGKIGASCEVHYSASKAAIDGLTKALAKEMGPSNIRVNSIAPGIIDTEMNKDLSDEDLQEIIKNEGFLLHFFVINSEKDFLNLQKNRI